MTLAPDPIRVLERVIRPAPLGLMVWDPVLGAPIKAGLDIVVQPANRPAQQIRLSANKSGIWIAGGLPGRASFDLPNPPRTFRITIADLSGDFLPTAFDADLPAGGLYGWPGWAGLAQPLLAPLQPLADRIPLFSSPVRQVGEPRAEVRCQLAERSTGRPAAWALVTASHAGVVCAMAMADAEGRASLLFPYPLRPRPSLATSPPAITDYRWPLEMTAYYQPAATNPAAIPDLAAVFAQLAHPVTLWRSTQGAGTPLPAALLTLGQPLVLRTETTAQGPSSRLMLGQP